ncbi:unnamed protein product [Ranitomeya imitator]|uniref:Uncharacterized protein n=1 Tax=Ranitomeya imitator TaxID=111125 RepID=A0ABN9LP86_9NEOB|nr:unnamed protein product [Ranitomeya imitator]
MESPAKCMRCCSEDEIKATLAKAKNNLVAIASKGIAIDHREVSKLVGDGKCLDSLISFLEGRGFVIYNKLLVPRTNSFKSTEESSILERKQTTWDIFLTNREQFKAGCKRKRPQTCNTGVTKQEEEAIRIMDMDEKDTYEKITEETGTASECEPKEEEEKKENSSLETKASEPNISWSNPLRKQMADSNMYMKPSLKTELLSGFVNFLSNTLAVQRRKQEAENVARFLYFIVNDKAKFTLR